MKLALLLLSVLQFGCSTLLDVERARELFRDVEEPAIPLLVDAPAAALPAPSGLRAISGQLRAVPLKWDPVFTHDVAGYLVERAKRMEDRFLRIAALPGRFETSYIDRGEDLAPKRGSKAVRSDLGDGALYYYRVRAFDSEGRVATEASTPVGASTAPVPIAPEGLRTYSHQPREVALTWRPSTDPTVAGYLVYRSPTLRGEFQQIARREGPFATDYVDRNLGALRVFYYRVSALNGAGGEGPATAAVRAVTKPEPLPPIRLRVEGQELGKNVLSWEPNVEEDIEGYRLLRRREGSDSDEVVAVVDAGVTRAEDREVGAGERLSYAALAFDSDGLESERSDAISVTSVAYGLSVQARDADVHLQWSEEVQEGFSEARILRLGTFGDREIGRSPTASFVDRDVKPGHRYRYVVILVREDGSEAPPSAVVEVEVPE